MSKEHDAPALTRREPKISNADHKAIAKAVRRDLRDRFAMAALTGILAEGSHALDNCANHAYIFADAMLEARGDE